MNVGYRSPPGREGIPPQAEGWAEKMNYNRTIAEKDNL
jgi:hypothetical protein